MERQNQLISFLVETFKRFGLKSPLFFQVWQWIGIIAFLVGFVPDALFYFNITPNDIWNERIEFALKLAGAVIWLQAKMPVANNVALGKIDELPYTAQNKELK